MSSVDTHIGLVYADYRHTETEGNKTMLRPHADNAPHMTRQHHENALLAAADLRTMGHFSQARALIEMAKRSRVAFGHLWLSHGRGA